MKDNIFLNSIERENADYLVTLTIRIPEEALFNTMCYHKLLRCCISFKSIKSQIRLFYDTQAYSGLCISEKLHIWYVIPFLF